MTSRSSALALALTLFMLALAPAASAQSLASCVEAACGDDELAFEPVLPAPVLPIAPAPVAPTDKRLFGVIPNYRADQYSQNYAPLSVHEKFQIAHSDSFDWPNYFLLAGYALQSQIASGGFNHNGGLTGFSKFYARGIGDQVIGSYVTEAILPSLLHEDPRFFRLGTGTLMHRTYHAARSIFVIRTDDGGEQFNISEIAGNAGIIAATTAYYPDSRTVGQGIERYGMTLGNDMISNLLTEFWPDIKRRLPFRHPSASAD